jgi:hypothetical protein
MNEFMTWVQSVSPMTLGIAMCAVIAAYLVYQRYRNRGYKSL